jgi:molybdopterin-guanine dinucleotide biosynthesis protein B
MILGVYGKSKSGKTTLVVKLISALKEKGYKVGSVKHIHIEDFTIDTEGKDTWEHTRAGSEVVVAHSEKEAAFIVNKKLTPLEVSGIIKNNVKLDIQLIEGHWDDTIPKIAVGDIEEKPNTILRYKDNFEEVLNYAVEGIEIDKVNDKLPGLDCGKCGKEKCIELAKVIHTGENKFEDCYYFSEKKVSLEVDGMEVPLGKFTKDIVSGTVAGMVSTLKGVDSPKKIRIEIEV